MAIVEKVRVSLLILSQRILARIRAFHFDKVVFNVVGLFGIKSSERETYTIVKMR